MSKSLQLDIKSLVLNVNNVKKGWNALSSFNDATEEIKKFTTESLTKSNEFNENISYDSSIKRIEIGQVYGRLQNELKLMQIYENEIKSMGYIEIISINPNFNFVDFEFRWKRKFGENLIDILNSTSQIKYYLTADDVGTTIIVEIKPKNDLENTLNITYAEIGSISIDEPTKISLLKSIKMGMIRFPVKIINDFDHHNESNNIKFNDENLITKDILIVTNDEIKVIKNGMSSINTNLDKKIEWSAKYFGGNIKVFIEHNTNKDFILSSGYDIHKQNIKIRATSRNSRDIIALTIRSLNVKHSISLENIIENLSFNDDPKNHNLNEIQKINILSYISKLEDEISYFLNKEVKYIQEKKKILLEKSLLENELSETITAYQDIISQYQQEKEYKEEKIPIQNFIFDSNSINKNSLIYGYNGYSQLNDDLKKINTLKNDFKDENHVKELLTNNKFKKEIDICNKECQVNEINFQDIDQLKKDNLIFKKQIDTLNSEKDELLKIINQQKLDIKNKDDELNQLRSYDLENIKKEKNTIQELQNRILEIQSQNFEKQEAIQVLLTEKSKLSRDYFNLKSDFDQLKEQHNELNKKYICLNIQNSNIKELSSKDLINNDENLKEKIQELNINLENYKSINSELNKTIEELKNRVRKLAMINSN